MALAEKYELVEALAFDGADEALGVSDQVAANPTLTTLFDFDSSPLDEARFGGFKEGSELLEAALAELAS